MADTNLPEKGDPNMKAASRIAISTLALILFFTISPIARADVLAFTLGQEFLATTNAPTTDGFLFEPTTSLVVTHLGYFDGPLTHPRDGLVFNHPVAIYDGLTQDLLVHQIIGPTTSLVIDGFRFEPITPLQLEAGRPYLLAGFHPGGADDQVAFSEVGGVSDAMVASLPQLGFQEYFFDDTAGSLVYPGNQLSGLFVFGPNLLIFSNPVATAVPEPATLGLIVIGLGALARWSLLQPRKRKWPQMNTDKHR